MIFLSTAFSMDVQGVSNNLHQQQCGCAVQGAVDSSYRWYGESTAPSIIDTRSRRLRVLVRRGVAIWIFLKSSIDFLNLKRLNHAFKGLIWQKRSRLNAITDAKSLFSITNISANSKSKSERKSSIRDLCRTDLCKKSTNPFHCHIPLKSEKKLNMID
jgi:hypothetical protein